LALLGFAVRRVLAALAAKLLELKTIGRLLFVFRREVIAILALGTLENDFISHNCLSEKNEAA
jgi:hypothetical protein